MRHHSSVRAEPTGYSLPVSPSGRAASVTPPPWHFAGDVIMVEYRVRPEAAARFLPAALEPDPAGAAAAVFAEWQWCSDSGDELAEPARCQFSEFLVLLGCTHRGRLVARCPYAWVDQPVPLLRGWIQGMPKQLGSVHQTRAKDVGRAGPRQGSPGRYDCTVSVLGRRLAEATVMVSERATEPPPLHAVPLVHTRLFPAWVDDQPPLQQLVVSEVTGVEFGDIWTGVADFRLFSDRDDDFARLAPLEIGRGYVFPYAETLRGGRPLADSIQ
jgi:enduracididine biosynthesis enzyme MppR